MQPRYGVPSRPGLTHSFVATPHVVVLRSHEPSSRALRRSSCYIHNITTPSCHDGGGVGQGFHLSASPSPQKTYLTHNPHAFGACTHVPETPDVSRSHFRTFVRKSSQLPNVCSSESVGKSTKPNVRVCQHFLSLRVAHTRTEARLSMSTVTHTDSAPLLTHSHTDAHADLW